MGLWNILPGSVGILVGPVGILVGPVGILVGLVDGAHIIYPCIQRGQMRLYSMNNDS